MRGVPAARQLSAGPLDGRYVHRLAILSGTVGLIAALGCVSPNAGIWQRLPGDVLKHVPYGVRFPATSSELARTGHHEYDATGRDVSVAYDRSSPRLALTVYLYPPGLGDELTPEQEFVGVMQTILQRWKQAEVTSSVLRDLKLSSGTRAFYVGLVSGQLGGEAVESFVIITHYDSVALKFRATFPAGSAEEAWRSLQIVLDGLDAQLSSPAV